MLNIQSQNSLIWSAFNQFFKFNQNPDAKRVYYREHNKPISPLCTKKLQEWNNSIAHKYISILREREREKECVPEKQRIVAWGGGDWRWTERPERSDRLPLLWWCLLCCSHRWLRLPLLIIVCLHYKLQGSLCLSNYLTLTICSAASV